MILSFMTKWSNECMGDLAGKPTHFVEKIWKSFPEEPICEELRNVVFSQNFDWNAYVHVLPKKHSIRNDWNGRWRPGLPIHYYIYPRTANMLNFFPVKPCISTQSIEIKRASGHRAIAYAPNGKSLDVLIDGRRLFVHEIDLLAMNDGFDDALDFFRYFGQNYKGKIIHWTYLKY